MRTLGAALREPDEGSALVQHQPAALNRQIKASLVFVRRAFLAKQERPVDQLDVDLAVPMRPCARSALPPVNRHRKHDAANPKPFTKADTAPVECAAIQTSNAYCQRQS